MKQGDRISVVTQELKKYTGEYRGFCISPHSGTEVLILISEEHGHAIDIEKTEIRGIWEAKK